MIKFSSKDIRDLEKWANELSKMDFLDPLLVQSAQDLVRDLKGESMDKDVDKLNEMANRMFDRLPAPSLTPEQLNAIDLLILGKTDREVAETIGVRRETITKWHRNPFFIAELNVKRDELWVDAKLRLKSLAHEAVNVLSNGLHSSDEKVAVTSAVHILKVVGLYDGKGLGSLSGPKTPEAATWDMLMDERLKIYRGARPDAVSDYSTREFTASLALKDTITYTPATYEDAVYDQRKELRDYRKKVKAQARLAQVEPVPPTIEDLPEGDGAESMKA